MSQATKTIITTRHMLYVLLVFLSIAGGVSVFLPWPMNMIPFGLILGILFVFVNFKYPMVGVFIYMFIFFFKPQDFIPIDLPYEKAIAITVIMTLLANIAFKEKKFQLYPMDKAFLSFMTVCFISIIFSGWYELAWDAFFKFFKVFLVYVFASRLADTPGRLKAIIWLYVLSIVFIILSTTINYYISGGSVSMGVERAGGIGENATDPNTLANTLVMGFPFLYFLFKYYKDNAYIKFFFGSMALLSIWTVIITGSRGGMLGVILTFFLLAISSKYKVVASASAVVVLGLFVVLMPQQYADRFASIFSVYSGEQTAAGVSAQGRVDGLVKGFVFLSQRPLFGVGIGNFKWANRGQYGIWLDSHNLLGKLAGELGLAGLISFGFFIYILISSIKMLKFIYHKYKWKQDFNWYVLEAISYSLVLLGYQGLISHNLFRSDWYIFACVIVIIMTIANNRIKQEKTENENMPGSEAIGVTR